MQENVPLPCRDSYSVKIENTPVAVQLRHFQIIRPPGGYVVSVGGRP